MILRITIFGPSIQFFFFLAGLILLVYPCRAQISTDGSFGPERSFSGTQVTIAPGVGSLVGSNLFHSFAEFNINTGQSVTFSGPNLIENVISRVTGMNSSLIEGELNLDIQNANFYFMNPNGVVFGKDAQLNIDGATVFTTADYIRLEQDRIFSTSIPNSSVLSIEPPEAFGFLDSSVAGIEINGATLSNSWSISLIGGDLGIKSVNMGTELVPNFIDPSIQVPSGRVNLVSVNSPGEAVLDASDINTDVDVTSFMEMGDVTLSNADFPTAISPAIVRLDGDPSVGGSGGHLAIYGKNVTLDRVKITSNSFGLAEGLDIDVNAEVLTMTNGSQIISDTGASPGGDINFIARSISITNGAVVSTSNFGIGEAGDITVLSEDLLIDFGFLQSNTFGQGGSGGSILIGTEESPVSTMALSSFDFPGLPPSISAQSIDLFGIPVRGPGGDVVVYADSLDIKNGGGISASTNSLGSGGSVKISAGSIRLFNDMPVSIFTGIAAQTQDPSTEAGEGGSIKITVNDLEIFDGAEVSATTTGGGRGGNVDIQAKRIKISGSETTPTLTAITAQSRSELPNGGRSGNINLKVDELELRGKAQISSSTIGGGSGGRITISGYAGEKAESILISEAPPGQFTGIDAQTLNRELVNAGNGGEIEINAKNLQISTGGAISTTTFGTGNGGNINLNIDALEILGTESDAISSIDSQTQGIGNSGNIRINSENLKLKGFAQVSAESELNASGKSGDIVIESHEINVEDGASIEISNDGIGEGGNVSIDLTGRLSLKRSQITAQSLGNGGNIFVKAGQVILDESRLTAKASQGSGGEIGIIAEVFIQSVESVIDVSSQFGVSGNVEIIAPDFEIVGSLALLPEAFLTSTIKLQEHCASNFSENISSFTAGGRGGNPIQPNGLLPASEFNDKRPKSNE